MLNYNDFLLNESKIELDPSLTFLLSDIKNRYKEEKEINKILMDFIDINNKDIESKKLPDSKYTIKPSTNIGRVIVGNNEYKIGKLLRILFPYLKDYEIEKFVNKYKAYQKYKKVSSNFKLIKENITSYYCMSISEIEEAGNVLNSCLVNQPDDFFDLFEKNSNVELLILTENEKLIGRSFVWTDVNGNKIMDRVYYKDDYLVDVFKTFARENGWYYRATQAYGNRYLSGPKGERVNDFKPIIKLENYKIIEDLNNYPYLDTFSFLNLTKGELCNFDVWGENDAVILLNVDNGYFLSVRNLNIYLKYLFDKMDFVGSFKENHYNIGWWFQEYILNVIIDKDRIIDYVFEDKRLDLIDNFEYIVTSSDVKDFLSEYSPKSNWENIVKNITSDNLEEFLKSQEKETNIMEEFYKYYIGNIDIGAAKEFLTIFNNPYEFLIDNNLIEKDTQVLANRFVVYLSDKSKSHVSNDSLVEVLNSIF